MSLGSNVYTATVLASVPEIGFAVVTRNKHNPQITDLIIAYLPYGDGPYGASPIPQIPIGSSVLCASYDSRPVAYILGCINDTPGNQLLGYGGELFYHVGKTAEKLFSMNLDAEHKYLDTLLADLGDYIRSARGATDGDARPGDYNVTDSMGLVGFHIGRLLSMLRGSPLAYVDVSAITHKVRMVGKTLEFHTLAGETVISETLHAVNTALSPREAMGLLHNDPAEAVDAIPDALPFYRMQQLKGQSPAGSEDAVLTPPADAELHTQAVQPVLLRKHRVGFSGEEQLLNAHSLGSVKTPDIRGIMQTSYDADAEEPATELRIPYEPDEAQDKEDLPEPPNEETAVDDAALHQKERYNADYTEMTEPHSS